MIHAVISKLIRHFIGFGFFVFVLSPIWNWINGRGLVYDQNWWFFALGYSIIIVVSELAAFRRWGRSKFQ